MNYQIALLDYSVLRECKNWFPLQNNKLYRSISLQIQAAPLITVLFLNYV